MDRPAWWFSNLASDLIALPRTLRDFSWHGKREFAWTVLNLVKILHLLLMFPWTLGNSIISELDELDGGVLHVVGEIPNTEKNLNILRPFSLKKTFEVDRKYNETVDWVFVYGEISMSDKFIFQENCPYVNVSISKILSYSKTIS